MTAAPSLHAAPAVYARYDLNGDEHVDLADFTLFAACRSGPAIPATDSDICSLADADRDLDVDLDDFGAWQRCVSGSLLATPDCAGLLNRFDFDGDGRVDDDDFDVMADCTSGAGVPATPSRSCRLADADGDGDVDSSDFGSFQLCYNPHAPADPACPELVPPTGLVTSVTGPEDTDVIITLTGRDPYRPNDTLAATIITLPTAGALFQFDGSPIATAPADVIDAAQRVRFRPAPDANGAPYASFAYSVISAETGLSSDPTTAQVTITPVNDPPYTIPASYTAYEDTPTIFTLGGGDVDMPNDTLTVRVLIRPNLGANFYQVDADGTPRLDLPRIENGDIVTNPEWKVCFVPPPNYYSMPALADVAFRYGITDASGASDSWNVLVEVISVNDPPIAYPRTFSAANSVPITTIDFRLSVSDVEVAINQQTYTFCFDTLPQEGTLYRTKVGDQLLDPITQAGACVQQLVIYYLRDDWEPFGCGPDPSPASYPRDDSFELRPYDGVDYGNVATQTLRMQYFNTPPVFTGPTLVTTSEETPVMFEPAASDIDNHASWFTVAAPLPAKGTLYFMTNDFGAVPVEVNQFTPEFPTRLIYVPLPNAHTADGTADIIHIRAWDQLPFENIGPPRDCDAQIQVQISPTNDPPSVTATLLAFASVSTDEPPVVLPAVDHSIFITDDALPTDLIKVRLRALGANADHLDLVNAAGVANVTQASPTEIQLEGTVASLNAAFGAGVRWWPKSTVDFETGPPDALVIDVDDQGRSGAENPPVPLTATRTISIAIDQPGGIPLD